MIAMRPTVPVKSGLASSFILGNSIALSVPVSDDLLQGAESTYVLHQHEQA